MELTKEELKKDLSILLDRTNDLDVLNYVYNVFKDEGETSDLDHERWFKHQEIENKLFEQEVKNNRVLFNTQINTLNTIAELSEKCLPKDKLEEFHKSFAIILEVMENDMDNYL